MKLFIKDNYIQLIKNSVDTKMFRNIFVEVDGVKKDITENGNLSCAYFVSSVLYIFKFITNIHATVKSTVKDLEESGWVEIEKPEVGCVLVWSETNFDGHGPHKHVGFYIGDQKAISNSDKLGTPVEHSWDFDGQRKLEKILWLPKIND